MFFFKNFMFEFQETQDVLFDKVIEISVSIATATKKTNKNYVRRIKLYRLRFYW